jgi:two-component system OmpR family response regulator
MMVAPAQPSHRSSRPLRVLLADDNHDFTDSMAELLVLSGCEVQCCNTAWAVHPRVQQFNPDVCIINVQMHVLNLWNIAPSLWALAGNRLLLLIAIIGCDGLKAEEKPMYVRFDHHILKPDHAEQLYKEFLKFIIEWSQFC